MAQLVLHILAQFGERLLEAVRHKQRIVAEAATAARSELNPAFASAVEDLRMEDGGRISTSAITQ